MADLELEDLFKFNETTGTIDPVDFGDVEKAAKSDVQETLGATGDIVPSTPFGRMFEWWTVFFTNVLGLNVQNANQMLVSAAAGQQLDAIAQWFQLERKPDSYSRVTVVCEGNVGTEIKAGARVRSTNGDIFESIDDAEITGEEGGLGSVKVEFEALAVGPIPVTANTVNIIDTIVSGWNSCNNPDTGHIGAALETDESLRTRIQNARTVAPGFIEAIKNGIESAVERPVTSIVIENNTGAHLEVQGVDMEPHTILVCIDGIMKGSKDERNVAEAIFKNKPCGTGYTHPMNSKTFGEAPDDPSSYESKVAVTDAYGNNYPVYFCHPIDLAIFTNIVVQNRSYTGTDLIGDVTTAFTQWYSTNNFGCGTPVFASDIITAVESAVSGVVVVECRVSDGGNDKGTSYVEVDAVHKAAFSTDQEHFTVSVFSR